MQISTLLNRLEGLSYYLIKMLELKKVLAECFLYCGCGAVTTCNIYELSELLVDLRKKNMQTLTLSIKLIINLRISTNSVHRE